MNLQNFIMNLMIHQKIIGLIHFHHLLVELSMVNLFVIIIYIYPFIVSKFFNISKVFSSFKIINLTLKVLWRKERNKQ